MLLAARLSKVVRFGVIPYSEHCHSPLPVRPEVITSSSTFGPFVLWKFHEGGQFCCCCAGPQFSEQHSHRTSMCSIFDAIAAGLLFKGLRLHMAMTNREFFCKLYFMSHERASASHLGHDPLKTCPQVCANNGGWVNSCCPCVDHSRSRPSSPNLTSIGRLPGGGIVSAL